MKTQERPTSNRRHPTKTTLFAALKLSTLGLLTVVLALGCQARGKTALELGSAEPKTRSTGENEGEPVSTLGFEKLAKDYLDEFTALNPVSATWIGDHRYDDKLTEVSAAKRSEQADFCARYLSRLNALEESELSRAEQVDAALLRHDLERSLFQLETSREWSWNPLRYTGLLGDSIYSLMSRDFAPVEERLDHVRARLEGFPRLLSQVRETLDIPRVPKIHADTAVKQNRGVLSIIEHMVQPAAEALDAKRKQNLDRAIAKAREAIDVHQKWLEEKLVPGAKGNFRIGAELYDQKLQYTLNSPLTRQEVRQRAESELARVREEMWKIAKTVYVEQHPYTAIPAKPDTAYKQSIIRAALERAYQDRPQAGKIVETAKASLKICEDFVRAKDLVTIPPDPVEIIVMPEFRRGVSLAYCDSPGPLDVGQKTFYAVAPLPADWTEEQTRSFLREYNTRSLHDLTVHEAMPGHFLQLAHSNRYPSTLRAVLSSGVFIEGWAVYAEQLMVEEGFLDSDPLMRLIAYKWYLRGIANAILDQAVHVDGIDREAAMDLMIEQTFQEEREAAGKWVRAQLTSAQLATYFVGYLEHVDLRRETEEAWGASFTLRKYHDSLLSFGSPPVQYARALLLDKPIPTR